jgi:stage II sporulation protein AA (anti-sigma F factor antagonist)
MGEAQRIRLDGSVSQGFGILTVSGECDLDGVSVLGRATAQLIADGHPCIVADLSRATFMDSSGINALLRANQATTAAGGWLRLVCVPGQVLRVLELVGLDQVMSLHADLDHALNA